MERAFRLLASRPWSALAIALLLTVVAACGASRLGLRTSRDALLPRQSEVVQRLERYLVRFGAASDLVVVLEQPAAAAADETAAARLDRFARELAERLNRRSELRWAVDRIDTGFLLDRSYLLVPPALLAQLARGIGSLAGDAPRLPEDWAGVLARAAHWLDEPAPGPAGAPALDRQTAVDLLGLLGSFVAEAERWLDAPTAPTALDLQGLLARHGAAGVASGAFLSRDGQMQFVFVRPASPSLEYADVTPWIRAVRQEAEELADRWRAAGTAPPRVGLTGLPAVTWEEYEALQHDIGWVVATAALGILLLIVLALRSLRRAVVIFAPMGLGVVWNLGAAWLLVGHLTILTSGFTAILFGLGVDYGIFVSSRILEEREAGATLLDAVSRGTARSLRAVLVAGGATSLILLTLTLSGFPGFVELGLIASSGVALVIVATLLVQPALFVLLPPRAKKAAKAGSCLESNPGAPAAPSGPASRGKRKVAAVLVGLAVLAAGAGAVAGLTMSFDYDVLALLPVDSEAAHYQRRMVAESDFQSEVVIFTAPSLEKARILARQAAALPALSRVQGITELFPPDAALRAEQARLLAAALARSRASARLDALGPFTLSADGQAGLLALLQRLEARLETAEEQAFAAGQAELVGPLEQVQSSLARLRRKLTADPERGRERAELLGRELLARARKLLPVLASWGQAAPLAPAELPPLLRQRFFADDGTVAFYAYPAHSIYDPQKLAELTRQVGGISSAATGFPITHEAFSTLLVAAFQRVAALAALAALLLLAVLLRRPRAILLAALPLVLGSGWMMALLWLSGRPFNFANVIALPLVMGLAIDYGVWFAHRWRELRGCSPLQVARRAGRPILLAAGTTLAGLGAITTASYQGIASLGVTITCGLVCCLAAALLLDPLIAMLLDGRRRG